MKKSFSYFLLVFCFFSFVAMPLLGKQKLQVIIFLSEECPISQYYAKEISRIDSIYKNDIELTCVFPMKSSSNEKISKFMKTFKANFRTTLDTSQSIAKKYKATTTPEVILISDGKIIYQGCIDDKYAAVGIRRSKVKNHYLVAAINQALLKKEIQNPTTKTVGCSITYF